MLSRTLRLRSALRVPSAVRTYSSAAKAEVPANDAASRKSVPTVSETNAMPTSSEGSFDKVLQESTEKAEALRRQQAPNREGIWSRSQQPREVAMRGPRFEQSIMEDQVRLNSPFPTRKENWRWWGEQLGHFAGSIASYTEEREQPEKSRNERRSSCGSIDQIRTQPS